MCFSLGRNYPEIKWTPVTDIFISDSDSLSKVWIELRRDLSGSNHIPSDGDKDCEP